MNINQAKEITKEIFIHDPKLVVCWVGGSGLGKTTMARALAEELAKPLVYAPIRTEDAMGLNMPNTARTSIEFMPHKRMADAIKKPSMIYLDEVNRVDRQSRTALMELLGERTIGGKPINAGTNILLTLNDESENYDTIEGDKAFKTRCIPIPVYFDANISIAYAKGKGFKRMEQFLIKNPQVLNEKLTWNMKVDTRFLEYLDRLSQVNSIPVSLYNEVVNFSLEKNVAGAFFKEAGKENILNTLRAGGSMADLLAEISNEAVGS